MDTKLTLKLNKEVIERAKKFAASKEISVSRLVENYLKTITQPEENNFKISPFVRSIATGKRIPGNISDEELRKDYKERLEHKHL